MVSSLLLSVGVGEHGQVTAGQGRDRDVGGRWLTDDSCTEPFSRMALMTSSSLLVPNSFSSWLLGALSYAPCAPWLFAEKEASVSKGSG